MAATKQTRGRRGAGAIYYDAVKRRWRATVKMPDGSRRSVSAPSQQEVIEARDAMIAETRNPAAPDSPAPKLAKGPTVAEVVKDWRTVILTANHRDKGPRKPGSQKPYLTATGHLIDGLGAVKLADLSVGHVNRYLLERANPPYGRNGAGLAANTLRTHLSVLGQVYDYAASQGLAGASNPARAAVIPGDAAQAALQRSLSHAECRQLLEAAVDSEVGHLIALALLTGCRLGELLGLSWPAVDWDSQTLTIRQAMSRGKTKRWEISSTKTGAVRVIPIGPRGIEHLRALEVGQQADAEIAPNWCNPDRLIFTRPCGKALSHHEVYWRFDRVVEAAGLLDVHFHTLRHTFGSLALDAGQEPIEIADQLGHTLQTFLKTYRHPLRPPVASVALAVESAVFAFARGPK